MNSISPGGGLAVQNPAAILKSFDKGSKEMEELKRDKATLERIEKELQVVDTLLSSGRKKRVEGFARLDSSHMSSLREKHAVDTKSSFVYLGCACTPLPLGMLAFKAPFSPILQMGTWILASAGLALVGGLIGMVVSRALERKLVDSDVVDKLEIKKICREREKAGYEQHLKEIESRIIRAAEKDGTDQPLQAVTENEATVDDGSEYINIDGVMLEKKKLAHLGAMMADGHRR